MGLVMAVAYGNCLWKLESNAKGWTDWGNKMWCHLEVETFQDYS